MCVCVRIPVNTCMYCVCECRTHSNVYEAVVECNLFLIPNHITVYKFLEVNFKSVVDIPVPLLKAISSCFKSKKEVCRLCFYEERVLSELVQATNTCSNGGHPWNKPLLVIKGWCMGV